MRHAEALNEQEKNEQMVRPSIEIHKVSDGLGFGDGSISAREIMEEAGAEAVAAAEAVITSPAILTPLGKDKNNNFVDDDGCGDGRKVGRIFQRFVEKFRSLNRAKVFGGGAAMATAAEIGLGRARGRSLQQVFSSSIEKLKSKKLNFGAHTADRVTNPDTDSGCGAIDNAPKIVAAAVEYGPQIQAVVEALNLNTEGLPAVMSHYRDYADEIKGQPYSGKEVVDEVSRLDKIIKELAGKHLEGYIILNYVHGYTVDQEAVRRATGGKIDVFAVDLWRLEGYARRLPDDPNEQNQTFLSQIVYTLATAGVLTKGDQPVYIIQPAKIVTPNSESPTDTISAEETVRQRPAGQV